MHLPSHPSCLSKPPSHGMPRRCVSYNLTSSEVNLLPQTSMSALQGTQPDSDALLWFKYGYVALTSLWVYDYVLCMPDSVTYLVESRWGLDTLLYLGCSYLPFAFLLLGMLTVFQPDASYTLCRSYDEANLYLGFLTMSSAEGIFILRTLAIYYRRRKCAVFIVISIIAYLVLAIVYLREFTLSVSGKCSIPGFIQDMDTKATSTVIVVYVLLGVTEFEILLFLLYRAAEIHSSGQRINDRLMHGLMHHKLLYFGCTFAFVVGLALAEIFFGFPVAHMVAESQVVAQALLATRIHRDLWNSDRASCGTYGDDLCLTTFVATASASDDGTGSF
ncbi:hypothetical protein EDB19DRAFT_92623 [Suillus lakei]|nr:hypothetical protein EDB19DRAFT_92623 [Suillus lakei]